MTEGKTCSRRTHRPRDMTRAHEP